MRRSAVQVHPSPPFKLLKINFFLLRAIVQFGADGPGFQRGFQGFGILCGSDCFAGLFPLTSPRSPRRPCLNRLTWCRFTLRIAARALPFSTDIFVLTRTWRNWQRTCVMSRKEKGRCASSGRDIGMDLRQCRIVRSLKSKKIRVSPASCRDSLVHGVTPAISLV